VLCVHVLKGYPCPRTERNVVMCVRGEGNRVGDVHACKGKWMGWDGRGWMMYSLCPDQVSGFGMNSLVAVCNLWRSSHSSQAKSSGISCVFVGAVLEGWGGWWTDLEDLRNLIWGEMKL
jgi:hypothetical protein